MQVEQSPLKVAIRDTGIFIAELDAIHPVLTDDAAPKRVVEIDSQHFCDATGERIEKLHPLADEVNELRRLDGQPRRYPEAFIVPGEITMTRDQRIIVQHVCMLGASRRA